MTRAGPARSLGLKDRGHLGVGACADITVYNDDPDREAMFTKPELVFKNGELIVRDGKVIKVVQGATHVARPEYDRAHREVAQGLLRPLSHRAHGQLPPLRRGDHRRRPRPAHRATDQGQRVMKVNGITIDDTFAEAFGMSATGVVITADTPHWARSGRRDHDRLRHLRHRLRRRGRHRPRAQARRDAGRPPRRARAAVRLFARRARPAAQEPRRPMRADEPRLGLLRGPRGQEADRARQGPRFFGDGFQTAKRLGESRYWRVPVMDGEFVVEETTGIMTDAVGGGNMLILGPDRAGLLTAAEGGRRDRRGPRRDHALPGRHRPLRL